MTLYQTILLGLIQGLTEFLPVSSSAHLVLVPFFLNWKLPAQEAFIFDVLVQLATLIAVVIYFWKDLLAIATAFFQGILKRQPWEAPLSRLGWFLILATLPAVALALLFKPWIEAAFSSPLFTALFLLITAGMLLVAEKAGHRTRPIEQMNWIDAFLIGAAQAISLLPGISRSGSTIAAGMTRNFDRPAAARFSFLMSIPIMIGAGLVAAWDLIRIPHVFQILPIFLPGFFTAALVGYVSIAWLLRYITRHSLYLFSAYCVLVSFLALALYSFRG